MVKFNQLQETFQSDWNGFTSENNLHAIGATEVQLASEFTSRLYESNYGMDLEGYLNQFKIFRL